jgi:antirestriction protein ArdC
MWNTTHKAVLDLLIPEIEAASPLSWTPPWTKLKPGERAHNAATGHIYRGVNVMLTGLARTVLGYEVNRWVTFKQIVDNGARLVPLKGAPKGKTGQKPITIIKMLDWIPPRQEEVEASDDGTFRKKPIKILKAYNVFNVMQTHSGPPEWYVKPDARLFTDGSRLEIDTLIEARKIHIVYDDSQPRFSPMLDMIYMPHVATFKTPEDFEATRLHECIHWTGHKTRLAREHLSAANKADYAREELVAEMGAAFLGTEFGLSGRLQHAEYLANWLQILKDKPAELMTAASHASKAADYLMGRQTPVASKEAA